MRVSLSHKNTALRIVVMLVASVIVAGCSGMTSVDLRNNREEGPENGIFSGSQGEFVIFRTEEAAKTTQVGTKSKTLEQ